MTEEKKELKIEFAPGCFDNFEGSQEELDDLVKEIQEMFTSKTREEIEAMSRPLSEEDWDELPNELKEQLIEIQNDEEPTNKRKLQ